MFTEYELQILRVMLFSGDVRYTDMNTSHLSTDHFTYYLKKLRNANLIIRKDNGYYCLSEEGKVVMGKIDGHTTQFEEQPKTIVIGVCEKIAASISYFVIQKRKKQPHRDYLCLPGGKCRAGENMLTAVRREVFEETGLTGEPVLTEIRHAIKLSRDNDALIADDIFYVYYFKNLSGKMVESTPEGDNYWLTIDEIKKQDLVVKNTIPSIGSINNQQVVFLEETHYYDS